MCVCMYICANGAENLELHVLSYGCWVQVVAAVAGNDAGVTWREGEAILEIEMRRGIRPDFQQFVSLMEAVHQQAERGVPTPISPG